jgi:hypothetical protein
MKIDFRYFFENESANLLVYENYYELFQPPFENSVFSFSSFFEEKITIDQLSLKKHWVGLASWMLLRPWFSRDPVVVRMFGVPTPDKTVDDFIKQVLFNFKKLIDSTKSGGDDLSNTKKQELEYVLSIMSQLPRAFTEILKSLISKKKFDLQKYDRFDFVRYNISTAIEYSAVSNPIAPGERVSGLVASSLSRIFKRPCVFRLPSLPPNSKSPFSELSTDSPLDFFVVCPSIVNNIEYFQSSSSSSRMVPQILNRNSIGKLLSSDELIKKVDALGQERTIAVDYKWSPSLGFPSQDSRQLLQRVSNVFKECYNLRIIKSTDQYKEYSLKEKVWLHDKIFQRIHGSVSSYLEPNIKQISACIALSVEIFGM